MTSTLVVGVGALILLPHIIPPSGFISNSDEHSRRIERLNKCIPLFSFSLMYDEVHLISLLVIRINPIKIVHPSGKKIGYNGIPTYRVCWDYLNRVSELKGF